jgi:hypothetical protein
MDLEDSSTSVMTPDTFNSVAKRNSKALMPILKVLVKRLRNTLKIIGGIDEQKPDSQASVFLLLKVKIVRGYENEILQKR